MCAFDPQSLEEWQQVLSEAPLPSKWHHLTPEPASRWIVPLYLQLAQNGDARRLPIGDVISTFLEVVPATEHVVPLLLILLVLDGDPWQ